MICINNKHESLAPFVNNRKQIKCLCCRCKQYSFGNASVNNILNFHTECILSRALCFTTNSDIDAGNILVIALRRVV